MRKRKLQVYLKTLSSGIIVAKAVLLPMHKPTYKNQFAKEPVLFRSFWIHPTLVYKMMKNKLKNFKLRTSSRYENRNVQGSDTIGDAMKNKCWQHKNKFKTKPVIET